MSAKMTGLYEDHEVVFISRCRVCGKMPGFVGVKKQSGVIYHRVACGNCGHCATSPLSKSVEEAIIRWNEENKNAA